MSRKGEKLLILPFEFKFSDKGKWAEEHAILLKAPSMADFATHNKMVAFASGALDAVRKSEAATLASMGAATLERLMSARADFEKDRAEAEPVEQTDDEAAEFAMQTFAGGLGERFPDFMDFLKKALTNNRRIASIGDSGQPITDQVWEAIDEKGGMQAVTLVLMSFANFFLPALSSKSPKESGDERSTTSSSATKAALN